MHYEIEYSERSENCLQAFLMECLRLDDHAAIETSFLVLPNAVPQFDNYLDLVADAERILSKKDMKVFTR
ncbi:MAG: DUF1415 family protein [Bacteroidota bacterium]